MVYNHQWVDLYSISRIQHLNRDGSDHCPLLVSCSISSFKGPSSLRFLHALVRHHGFLSFVEINWKHLIQATGMKAFLGK